MKKSIHISLHRSLLIAVNVFRRPLDTTGHYFIFSVTRNSIPDTNSLSIIIQRLESNTLPLISVIVPTYQEEKILERCLKVFTPERKARFQLELIVSDGGSDEQTIDISRRYADCIVQYTGTARQGIAQGRNDGAAHARGSILMFLNGDTIIQDVDAFLEFVFLWGTGSTRHSDAPALACRIDVFPEERIWIDTIFYAIHNQYVRLLNAVGMGMCRGECQIMKRTAFDQVGGYRGHLMAGEDFELYTRLAKLGRIRFIDALTVLESPRRFRDQGYIRTILLWTLNSLYVMYLQRSYSKQWKDIR